MLAGPVAHAVGAACQLAGDRLREILASIGVQADGALIALRNPGTRAAVAAINELIEAISGLGSACRDCLAGR